MNPMGSLMVTIEHLWIVLSATLSSSVACPCQGNSSPFDFMICELGLDKFARRRQCRRAYKTFDLQGILENHWLLINSKMTAIMSMDIL